MVEASEVCALPYVSTCTQTSVGLGPIPAPSTLLSLTLLVFQMVISTNTGFRSAMIGSCGKVALERDVGEADWTHVLVASTCLIPAASLTLVSSVASRRFSHHAG